MATPFTYTSLCQQVELQAMAEDLALLGYQDPKFSWQMPCKYVALDVNTPTDTRAGDHPVIHSTIDFRSQIKAAWPVLLDQLQQSGIPIPDVARTPILPGINDTCRNRVRPDGLEVNCFVVEFDGTEGWTLMTYSSGTTGLSIILQNGFKKGYEERTPVVNGYISTSAGSMGSDFSQEGYAYLRGSANACILRINDSKYNVAQWKAHLAELKAQGNPLQAVVQLAEPIFIPFENPVNLSLGELSKYTFIGAHDINDERMYDLQTHFPYGDAPENPDGHHHFLLTRWNADWLREHNEFPMTAITTFDGIGFVANYDSAFTDHFLLQDIVKQLKDKGIIQ